ncbi:laminin subunit gamma-1 [Parasteatoda tepidariorum]|uniref:laminin subunit gamma-1 n=1 Tax=Parasteatoda tepidariorum TaxID=114398 RepID=UPI001C71DB78|nr:laminin subunit gamma-1 [Parasteatoda tepidariorum]
MPEYYKCIVFFLSVSLFFSVSVRARNVFEIFDEQIKNISQTIGISSDKTRPFGYENKSFHDPQCDCGFGSSGCDYKDGKKICKCDWQYSQNNDKCERCYCGIFASKCYFENNKIKCSCFGKYKQNSLDECAECDCGFDSKSCEFSGYSKVCTCNSGYIVIRDKCEKCDCGPMSLSCDLTYDKYTRCTCQPGYVAKRSRWEMDEKCETPGPSGWKVATYIESVIFGLTILTCTIILCCKRKPS